MSFNLAGRRYLKSVLRFLLGSRENNLFTFVHLNLMFLYIINLSAPLTNNVTQISLSYLNSLRAHWWCQRLQINLICWESVAPFTTENIKDTKKKHNIDVCLPNEQSSSKARNKDWTWDEWHLEITYINFVFFF